MVYLPVTLLSCMCMNIHKPLILLRAFYCLYLSTGDISSGLDTQFKMTGRPNRIWGAMQLSVHADPCADREAEGTSSAALRWEVTGSNHRCCALQQDTSRLNSVNGFEECESARRDQRSQPIRIQFTLYLLGRLWLSRPGFKQWAVDKDVNGVLLAGLSQCNEVS